jgi:hypothetical protein
VLAALLATSIVAFAGGVSAIANTPQAHDHRTSNAAVPEEWTRLHEALARRTLHDGKVVGLDEAELLLWPDSDYVLEEERLKELRAALAAFRAAGPRGPEVDALRRVLMQQELWATFDWAFARTFWTNGEQASTLTELAREIAAALAHTAPTAAEIASLPDSLAAAEAAGSVPTEPDLSDPQRPFLPRGLASGTDEFVYVRNGTSAEPLAQVHATARDGRELFGVALRLPAGRDATLAWIAKLPTSGTRCDGAICGPIFDAPNRLHEHLDPAHVALPPGTMVALVQRALAFDDKGMLHATRLALRVQVRTYLALPEDIASVSRYEQPPGFPWQAVSEHALVPSRLLAGEGGCFVALQRGESAYFFVASHGDPIEHYVPASPEMSRFGRLDSCMLCHGAVGLASVNSYTGIMSGPNTQGDVPLIELPRSFVPADEEALAVSAAVFKRARSDWGALWAWGWGARQ